MTQLNRQLLKTLGLCCLNFLAIGLGIALLFPIPTLAVLIDRSYCPSEQWQDIAQQYETLYQQHQRGQIRIQPVVLFSDLDQEVRSSPPTPAEIQSSHTYGRPNVQQQQQLKSTYPNAHLLVCQ